MIHSVLSKKLNLYPETLKSWVGVQWDESYRMADKMLL